MFPRLLTIAILLALPRFIKWLTTPRVWAYRIRHRHLSGIWYRFDGTWTIEEFSTLYTEYEDAKRVADDIGGYTISVRFRAKRNDSDYF